MGSRGNGVGEELPSLQAGHSILFSDPEGEQKPAPGTTGPQGAQGTRVLLSSLCAPVSQALAPFQKLPAMEHETVIFHKNRCGQEALPFLSIFLN